MSPRSPHQPTATRPSLKLKKGTKMTQIPHIDSPFPALNTFNSSFQMAEYLAFIVKKDPMDVERIVELPKGVGGGGMGSGWGGAGDGGVVAEGEVGAGAGTGEGSGASKKEVDLWIYEHLRRLPLDLTQLVTSLLPVCDRHTCPEMKAAEWVYLCVAHPVGAGGAHGGSGVGTGFGEAAIEGCSAIDYILHTLDQHTALWNSSQAFPSRLSIKAGSERYFGQQTRRISRVFGHAWFHHREVFEECEAESALYARFLALVRKYHLMAEELLVIPWDKVEPEAEGSGGRSDTQTSAWDKGEGAQDDKKGGAGLKRSTTVMSASASGRSGGKTRRAEEGDDDQDGRDVRKDDGQQEEDHRSATDPDPRGIVATAVRKPEAARDMTLSRRGGAGGRARAAGAGGKTVATRGRKRLFQVDIPKEDDDEDDDDDLERSPAVAKFSPLTKSPVNARTTGTFVGKQVTPTMRDLEASELGKRGSGGKGDEGMAVDPLARDSSESDESDDSEGNSDPESAVNPGKTLVDSDDEGEEMVEDVGAVEKKEKTKDEGEKQGGDGGAGSS